MVTVEFLGPIQKQPLQVEITNLDELSAILRTDPPMEDWLSNCAIAINDTLIQDKGVVLKNGDRISLLPPVCGG